MMAELPSGFLRISILRPDQVSSTAHTAQAERYYACFHKLTGETDVVVFDRETVETSGADFTPNVSDKERRLDATAYFAELP